MARHNLVDRFRLDHLGRGMWTWLDSSPSVFAKYYLNRVLGRRADTDFVTIPMFYYVGQTDHRLVRVSLQLVDRPSLASYQKFNTSLLEIQDFWDRLESLVQWALVQAVTRNKWWVSLKHRIRDSAIKYGRQLNLDRTKVPQSQGFIHGDHLCSLGWKLHKRRMAIPWKGQKGGHKVGGVGAPLPP